MNTFSRTVALAAALLSAPLFAAEEPKLKLGPVEEKDFATGKAKRDPAAGYIFVQLPYRLFGTFLRVPDEETRAEYQKDGDKAFAKAQKDYVGKLKSWESEVKAAEQTHAKVSPKPVEPTKETFRIESIELRDMVSYGPMFIFNKGEKRFAYMNAVKPGNYIYYGIMMTGAAVPAAGSCYCMGTVKFEVKPGTITDLGNSLLFAGKAAPPYDVSTQLAMKYAEERAAKGKPPVLPVQEVMFGLPESLKDWPSQQVEFHASGKINNYFGLPISRMPPVPGVLGYRRDTVQDLRTGQDVVSETIYSLAKKKM